MQRVWHAAYLMANEDIKSFAQAEGFRKSKGVLRMDKRQWVGAAGQGPMNREALLELSFLPTNKSWQTTS